VLQKQYRLKKKKDFERVFKKGYYSPTPLWTLKWMRNELTHPRYGLVVSNNISKSAVARNKIKRRLRSIVKKYQIVYPVDIVVITKLPILKSSFNEMDTVYAHQLKKIISLFEQ